MVLQTHGRRGVVVGEKAGREAWEESDGSVPVVGRETTVSRADGRT